MEEGQSAYDRASISSKKGTLPEEKLRLFRQYAQGLSVFHLEEEMTVFADGHKVRQGIIDFIRQRTEQNSRFPLVGHIIKIGSSWDGTKVGHLDEVDTLYVLNKDQVTIIPDEENAFNFRVRWNENVYSPCQLNEQFEKALDSALCTKAPEGMEYNGYKTPRYSGTRVNGPAVTVLFRTAKEVGRMERGSMVSLDITLAIPFSHLPSQHQHTVTDVESWYRQYIIFTNTSQPIDVKEPHVIPCRIKGAWKPTTAHIEAEALHELQQECSVKRAHVLLKCLMRKVDKFNDEHEMFQVEEAVNDVHTKLMEDMSKLYDQTDMDQCMRYGYIWLSPRERRQFNELQKKAISINAAAAKQILLMKAQEEDFKPGCADRSRALCLMREVLTDVTKRGSMFITNHIMKSFPPIFKFSVRETLAEKLEELGTNLLCQYDILCSSIFTHVSISKRHISQRSQVRPYVTILPSIGNHIWRVQSQHHF